MMDWFITYLPQIFVVLGLILVLLELLLGIEASFDMVLIGSILIISGFFGILIGSVPLMLILASVLSVLYILVGRRKIRQRITVTTSHTNIDRIVGATGTVVKQISPETAGIVRLNDEQWRAAANEVLYENDVVTVEGIEGVTVVVRKLAK